MPATTPAALDPGSFTRFGELLRFLRRRANLTQRDLSLAVGYNFIQPDPCQSSCGSDRLLTGLAPVVEIHSNTPLNHREMVQRWIGSSS